MTNQNAEMMRGIYYDGTKAVYREDLPVPEPEDGHSRIRILYANICSTDKEILRGYRPDFQGIMGHEFVGIVDKTALPSLQGRLVTGELNEGCGHCLYCRSDREKHCPERKVIGLSKDGCFAEYMTLADHLIHPVPEGLPPEKAVYTEPLAAALEIPSMVHIDPAKKTAVIGDGRLAFMIAQVLSLSGAPLTVIGKHEEKLAAFEPFAQTRLVDSFHFGHAEDGIDEPPMDRIEEDTYEVIIEASGSPSGLMLASRIIRRQGTIVLKSTYAGKLSLDMSHFVVNEITIKGSRCGPFEPALNLLQRGLIRLPQAQWHDLKDYEAAFASKAFKAGFKIAK